MMVWARGMDESYMGHGTWRRACYSIYSQALRQMHSVRGLRAETASWGSATPLAAKVQCSAVAHWAAAVCVVG